jgi:hypothetical protein
MEIAFSGKLSYEELTFVIRQASPVRKITFVIGLAVLVMMNILLFAITSRSGPYTDWSSLVTYALPFDVMVVAFFFTFIVLNPAMAAQRAFKQNQEITGLLWGSVNAARIAINSAQTKGELSWDLYKSARLFPGLVLLNQRSGLANFFPRSFFASDADWLAFRALVIEKISEHRQHDRASRLFLNVRNPRLVLYTILAVLIVLVVAYNFWNIY